MAEKRTNLNINQSLWEAVRVRAVELGQDCKDFVADALKAAVQSETFVVTAVFPGTFGRRTIYIDEGLWSRVGVKAAELAQETGKTVSRRMIVEGALAEALTQRKRRQSAVFYRQQEGGLLTNPISLSMQAYDQLHRAGAEYNLSITALIDVFAAGLGGDPILQRWFDKQVGS